MSEISARPESIIRDCPRMGPDDRFTFQCGRSLQCFTQCCSDVTIVLTPYDVLRLKQALKSDSSEFLAHHTLSPFAEDQKIPAVILKMDPDTKRCPFVTEAGCGVYADRPWACRMYPLGVAHPDVPTPEDRAFHFLIREDICRGHDSARSLTVREWIEEQGLEEYEMMGAPFKELMLHPFWNEEKDLTPEQIDMFFMACYDLDRFRRFVFETRLLRLFVIDESRIEAMRTDDVELLDFGMQWLKFCLFHERTMKINLSTAAARRPAAEQAR